jgi:hypothetical protein
MKSRAPLPRSDWLRKPFFNFTPASSQNYDLRVKMADKLTQIQDAVDQVYFPFGFAKLMLTQSSSQTNSSPPSTMSTNTTNRKSWAQGTRSEKTRRMKPYSESQMVYLLKST